MLHEDMCCASETRGKLRLLDGTRSFFADD